MGLSADQADGSSPRPARIAASRRAASVAAAEVRRRTARAGRLGRGPARRGMPGTVQRRTADRPRLCRLGAPGQLCGQLYAVRGELGGLAGHVGGRGPLGEVTVPGQHRPQQPDRLVRIVGHPAPHPDPVPDQLVDVP